MIYGFNMITKIFESREAAKIIGIEERVLRYWATIKVISPAQDTPGVPGKRRRYSFYNLVEGAIIRELKKQGVSINLGLKALLKLKEQKLTGMEICFLVIIGGDTIDVIVPKLDNTNIMDLLKELSEGTTPSLDELNTNSIAITSRSSHDTFLDLIRNGFPLRQKKEELKEKKLGEKILDLLWFSELGKKIISYKESLLIIPVHFLWTEIEKKVQ